MFRSLFRLRRFLTLKFFKNTFLRDYRAQGSKKTGHALLYYKTDPFVFPDLTLQYEHTNDWEVVEIAQILNRMGYWVDIVDRDIDMNTFNVEDKYDIFIGLGAGNSGKYFAEIGRHLTKAIRIFLAAGPDPDLSNDLILKRYAYFRQRHPGKDLLLRRMIDKVDMTKAMAVTDAIFAIGNHFSLQSYQKYNKMIYAIYPSTSPNLSADNNQLTKRDSHKFLYFGGSGNVVKGLDLLLEVFQDLPQHELYICAPKEETDFMDFYKDTLRLKNIHFLGFITVGGKLFNQVTSKCGYFVLPSCSEGIATSGVTCMRRGLIPITTCESGIDLGDFGFLIKDIEISSLKKLIQHASQISHEEFTRRSVQTYQNSQRYTQLSFSRQFEASLSQVLRDSKMKVYESQ